MDTKEAIGMICIGREQPLEFDEAHEIVELLKRGEKYEQMYKEFKGKYKTDYLYKLMENLEQKYFPKKVIK